MMQSDPHRPPADVALSDEEIVVRVLGGEAWRFEQIIRRHNRRLFRVARAIVRNDAEAEDVMQESYVRAYAHLRQFEGRASFATWITRIAVHEAFARVRRVRQQKNFVDDGNLEEPTAGKMSMVPPNPERRAAERELGAMLEAAIDGLPAHFRTVFVLRAVEGLSVVEAAECLDLAEETVKTRFFRARGLLRDALAERFEALAPDAYEFHLVRCDGIVEAVMGRLGLPTDLAARAVSSTSR